jgi:hypothetical protein
MREKSIKFLENSNIEMSFTNKMMTSYGGFSLLAKLFEKLNLQETLETIFPVEEISRNSKGIYSKLLKYGLTVLAGGKRFTHSIFLGNSDKIYEEIFGVKKLVKSSTAITRMFNKISCPLIASKLSQALWDYMFKAIIPFETIKEDYLNFDSKVITRYGNQDGASKGYNPKKKGRPIMAFLNKSKYIVHFWNRDGSSSSGNGIVEFLKETFEKLNGKINIQGCIGDTGFYGIDLIQYLESLSIPYILGSPLREIVQKKIVQVLSWEQIDDGLEIAEFYFQHKDEKWDKDRRYIVVRQEIGVKEDARGKQLKIFQDDFDVSRYRYSCFVTSFDCTPLEVWRTYRSRAADENIIKENSLDFGLDGFSLHNFYATEAAMLIRVLFYNIINFFHRL